MGVIYVQIGGTLPSAQGQYPQAIEYYRKGS